MSPFAASSSAFYDCVSACDPMTVDALVMRGGRGGSKGCVDAASRGGGGGGGKRGLFGRPPGGGGGGGTKLRMAQF